MACYNPGCMGNYDFDHIALFARKRFVEGYDTVTLLQQAESQCEKEEIIDRWLDPAHRYFKLRGDDGGIYILRYEGATDRWELILFDSGTRDETRLSST